MIRATRIDRGNKGACDAETAMVTTGKVQNLPSINLLGALKMVAGRQSFPFGKIYFQVQNLSFREGISLVSRNIILDKHKEKEKERAKSQKQLSFR